MDNDELLAIAKLAYNETEENASDSPTANFLGQSSVSGDAENDEEPLVAPVLNFEEEKKATG